ncbi:TPA: hypothetical protein U2L28_003383 [Burkholderia multivorans]|nr:hypothetical protein [Burkholderia multivorans]
MAACFKLPGIVEGEIMSDLIFRISECFKSRKKPDVLVGSNELTYDEIEEVNFVGAYDWSETTGDLWEKYSAVLSWFSPDAFCYYLPGVMVSSIKENEPNLIVVSNLIGMLDRTPNSDWWDDFFVARWPLLTLKECNALQEWLIWLSSAENSSFDQNSIERALGTIGLLIYRKRIA